ncbi:Bowman-Birk type wound-induced trypsin inhibitor-like [Neltuma alba]|uniref:Bowman-Birk type wound-induced trypsin inhibitor-like n=1 Tax=Neltuma alba TaxID=207710 RepID=UPI0010A3326F|nr:Bowman-Birk type wound-induced trypsin inhibitor-like [Prosopis alba]
MVKAVGVVILFLMVAAFTVVVEAQMVKQNYSINSPATACCNDCTCTKSDPPQCECNDWGEACHSACERCICRLIYPPRCRCYDTTPFCFHKCSSSSVKPSGQNP